MAKNETMKKLNQRVIREFLDIIVLGKLEEKNLNGYEIILYLNSRFRTVVSAGTIYGLMYSMERKGLIEGIWANGKREYKLTQEGHKTLTELNSASGAIKNLLTELFA